MNIEEFAELVTQVEGLPPADRAEMLQGYFNKYLQPEYHTYTPKQRLVIGEMMGEGVKLPFFADRTKESLAPMQPGFSASDMQGVFKNPQASFGDKANAALGYLSHYPDMLTKAVAPPAFWRGHEQDSGTLGKAFDFLPFSQSYRVLGAMGEDAARGMGVPEWMGGLGAGILSAGRVGSPTPVMRMLGKGLGRFAPSGAQMQSPILQRLLARFGQKPSATGGAAAPGMSAGASPSSMGGIDDATSAMSSPRLKLRYGRPPEGGDQGWLSVP